jgi:hypothetical protein
MRGEPLHDSSGRGAVAVARPVERVRDGAFHGSIAPAIRTESPRGEPQHGTAAIARIVGAYQQALCGEPLNHSGQRARMNMQHDRQLACRESRKQTDDAEHESLRSRDADVAVHALGEALETVNDGPEHAHELQHVWQNPRLVLIF